MNNSDIHRTLTRISRRLLDARNPDGYWTGELSASALSTATAVIALYLDDPSNPLSAAGLDWLEKNQNPDGGFGDTILSMSNLSTTALCWAALHIAGRRGAAMDRAVKWIHQTAGGLEPKALVPALAALYGKDHTFSVPILTVLAVAGLVPWRLVPQLPFEMAALPRSWFARLGLPVVSYALPALIAIGQVRHRKRPSRNPAATLLRTLAAARTLRVLESIQPASGGYLEAAPLTSFVCISLLAAGLAGNSVRMRALHFLRRSIRADGSWPIDTNIATWVSTLSVNALRNRLPERERGAILAWLLGQQYHSLHPYTGASPGGWAWTHLSGGVPDADDTAGALAALDTLGVRNSEIVAAAASGVRWLLDLQNRDGGMPTFCRGWGKLPFDRSSSDITAHALLAWSAWRSHLSPADQARIDAAICSAVSFLENAQKPQGSWTPLWFGNQLARDEENPVYGTARVLLGLQRVTPASSAVQRGLRWLCSVQNEDGGWGGDGAVQSSLEETSLAVSALAGSRDDSARQAARKGAAWIIQTTRGGEATPPSPIGLYFARLWYYESLYPLIFAVDALNRVADDRG